MEDEFEQWMRQNFAKPYEQEGWNRQNMKDAYRAGENKSNRLEKLVMLKIAGIAEKALTQWRLHIEENEQSDLEDINHLEALEWKKLNAELESIKSNFSA